VTESLWESQFKGVVEKQTGLDDAVSSVASHTGSARTKSIGLHDVPVSRAAEANNWELATPLETLFQESVQES
jgi:hypothetical protein